MIRKYSHFTNGVLLSLLAIAVICSGASAQETKEGLALSVKEYRKFVEAFSDVQPSTGADAQDQAAPRIVIEDQRPEYHKTSYVLQDSIGNSESLDIINTNPANDPPTVGEWYSQYVAASEESCKSDWRLLDENEDSLFFERITRGCPSLGIQHGLYKVLYGERNNFVLIAMHSPEMNQETHGHWLNILGSAHIATGPTPPSAATAVDWSGAESTPEFELVATEIFRKQGQEDGPDVAYAFSVSGPRTALKKETFSFLLKELGREPVLVGRNLTVKRSGKLMKSNNEPAEIGLGRFADGEPVMVAVVSGDERISILASIIPFPIQADSGPCRIEGELIALTQDGPAYTFAGEGFVPGEHVSTEARFGNWISESSSEVESNGAFGQIFLPDRSDMLEGTGSYRVVGEHCSINLEFQTPVM